MKRSLRDLFFLLLGAGGVLLAERLLRRLGPTEAYDQRLPEGDEDDLFPTQNAGPATTIAAPWSETGEAAGERQAASGATPRRRRTKGEQARIQAAALAAAAARKGRRTTRARRTPKGDA